MRRLNYAEPTMELIESKSHWDGDCLIWDGACAHKAPYMSLNRKSVAVRRWIAVNILKLPMAKRLATFTCTNSLCVNPEHVAAMTRAQLQQLHADRVQYGKNPARAKKLADAKRKHSRFKAEDIQKVHEWTGSQRELARQMGVSFDWVNKVVRGVIWKDYSNPFAGLMNPAR